MRIVCDQGDFGFRLHLQRHLLPLACFCREITVFSVELKGVLLLGTADAFGLKHLHTLHDERSAMLNSRTNSRRNKSLGPVEALEQKTVLAGNMAAYFADGALVLVGDSNSNSVEIAPNADGGISIFPVDGTTVNGSFDPVEVNADEYLPEDISIATGAGRDSVLIEAIDVGGHITMLGGRGYDKLDLLDVAVLGDVYFGGGRGNDTLILEDSAVGGTVESSLGRGHDDVLIESSLVVGNVNLLGGSHHDDFDVNNSVIESNLRIAGGTGRDNAVVSNSEIDGQTTALMGRGEDGLGFVDSIFSGLVYGNGGRDGDTLLLDSPFDAGAEFYKFEFDA